MESAMFADLLAAQKEMPDLQRSAINPHFQNRYVPLEELIEKVVPVLNKHNFVLMQMPGIGSEGIPVLHYLLRHASGEIIEGIMLLMAAKDDPQGQGSAITYARRYSLMAMLGLCADADDDANRAQNPPKPRQATGPMKAKQVGQAHPPACPTHGERTMRLWPAGVSKKTGNAYEAFWSCNDKTCADGFKGKAFTVDAETWKAMQAAEHNTEPPMAGDDFDADLPDE